MNIHGFPLGFPKTNPLPHLGSHSLMSSSPSMWAMTTAATALPQMLVRDRHSDMNLSSAAQLAIPKKNLKIRKAMEAMAHRNRWFTELKNGGSFHGELLNHQRLKFAGILLFYLLGMTKKLTIVTRAGCG